MTFLNKIYFSHLPQFWFWSVPKSLTTFFVFRLNFVFGPCPSATNTKAQLHNKISDNHFFRHFLGKISRFHPPFKTTNAQFSFYNYKLHFTTAEIVVSYTLKYTLPVYVRVCFL